MGSPCYPDEGCFLAMDGSVLLDDPNAYLGRVLKGRGVPNQHLQVAAIKRGDLTSLDLDLEAIRAF